MGTSRNEHLSLHFKLAVVYKWYRGLRMMPHLVNRPPSSRLVPHNVVPLPLHDLCFRAAHLGMAQTCRECLGLSVSTMEKHSMSLCHSFLSSKTGILPYTGILRIISGLGKLHLTPGKFRHINIFKFYTFMQSWAITSPAFKGSN